MGTADFASVLFLKFLKHNPLNPHWFDRDRFVLSAGHGSMLMYSLLHLSGYDVTMDDLKQFRQWDSSTPGHPEYGDTPGVETTTGPLGQGCGNAVGMAIAEAMLAARFNTKDAQIVDHYTYAIAGDGDLMEGISHEAFSLAGHLKLKKLIVFYDSNRITIEGETDLAYSDDVKKRFEGYNWNVLEIDGHDHAAIEGALTHAKESDRPTLIIGHTHIAKFSPNKQDTAGSHGAPLGDEEIAATKKAMGMPESETFYVSGEVYEIFSDKVEEWKASEETWLEKVNAFRHTSPELAKEWDQFLNTEMPDNLELPVFEAGKAVATRKASGEVLQKLAEQMGHLVGGSADLGPSNNTALKKSGSITADDFSGRNFHFGVREHGMAAIMNGMTLHGGFTTYGGTFLVFSDYMKPSIRLAALMKLPVIYVFTHDSIFLGEDGPTHQPIEHLATLRSIPNMTVLRPADASETAMSWKLALENRTGPTALILTRQNLPVLDRDEFPPAENISMGAYIMWRNTTTEPDLILMATGSEVHPTLEAAKKLAAKGVKLRLVNMASWELFEKQTGHFKDEMLPPACKKRIAVEAASPFGWGRYVGSEGCVIGMDRFGASAPASVLGEKFGFTSDNILAVAMDMLKLS